MRSASLGVVFLLFVSACSDETSISLAIDGDFEPGVDVDEIDLAMWDEGAQTWAVSHELAPGDSLPLSLSLRPTSRGAESVQLSVEGSRNARAVLAARRPISFVYGRSVEVRVCLWLECVGSSEPACLEGACDPPSADGDADADTDADEPAVVDAGADALEDGSSDVGVDADGSPDSAVDSSSDGGADAGCPPAVPLGGECDPMAQTCCGAGEGCVVADLSSAPHESCAEDVGDRGDGLPCRDAPGERLCRPGAMCVDLVDHQCASFCESDVDCPEPEHYSCVSLLEAPEYGICVPDPVDCDPTTDVGCSEPGHQCVLASDQSTVYTTCVSPPDSCGDHPRCEGGKMCILTTVAGQPFCHEFCRLSDGECPTVGLVCTRFGHAEFGLCHYI